VRHPSLITEHRLEARIGAAYCGSHVALWDVEYYQVPRGRVVFNKAEHRFYVYLHKVLRKARIKRMIVEPFHLPLKQTVFRTDLHYTTDPDDLDRLFSW
jgi:hypothetical protein